MALPGCWRRAVGGDCHSVPHPILSPMGSSALCLWPSLCHISSSPHNNTVKQMLLLSPTYRRETEAQRGEGSSRMLSQWVSELLIHPTPVLSQRSPHIGPAFCKQGPLRVWGDVAPAGGRGSPSSLNQQFPQPEASGGLQDCEKVSTGNESQEQLGPFGRQGPAALSPRRLSRLGPPRPLPQWVITTRCPAADVTLRAERVVGLWGALGILGPESTFQKEKGGGKVVSCSQCLASGQGHGQHGVPSAPLWDTTFSKSQFPSEQP